MSVDFSNGALGVIHATRWAAGHYNDLKLRIYGDKGGIEIDHKLTGTKMRACFGDNTETAEWVDIEPEATPTNYQRFAEAVKTGVNGEPDFRHAASLQKALDLAFVTEKDRIEHALL
jgi:predicted dehydrogenase